ncbi:hypothetical protein X566_20040 [Afipia sp. P52-10]|uniref:hypothetical protein n=1 Tax=Afipia sp. P52-10 TaxID=1429916 RepID=UPI0003DF1831|nr:hypothetical protein [Afipia sp. P52-10]ETR75905.1 hypothetical protein X566_20040 [Afipia sp. P52-10]
MTDRAAYDMSYFAGPDDDAGVSFDDFMIALAVWSWMRPGNNSPTVSEAADVFGVTHDVIRRAVNDHPWMLLEGPPDEPRRQRIEHDGA